jgi:hypothetical protein
MHKIRHAEQQPPPQHAAGMADRKILLVKALLFEQDDGKGITER